ncbi:hypothetical protein VTI74DRAFT_417 [Chaetomium olivicolor]
MCSRKERSPDLVADRAARVRPPCGRLQSADVCLGAPDLRNCAVGHPCCVLGRSAWKCSLQPWVSFSANGDAQRLSGPFASGKGGAQPAEDDRGQCKLPQEHSCVETADSNRSLAVLRNPTANFNKLDKFLKRTEFVRGENWHFGGFPGEVDQRSHY